MIRLQTTFLARAHRSTVCCRRLSGLRTMTKLSIFEVHLWVCIERNKKVELKELLGLDFVSLMNLIEMVWTC